MSIDAYCQAIKQECDTITNLWFVIRCELVLDIRPPDQAYLTGRVEWVNGSELHWMEFLDASLGTVEKLRYSYHFQDADKELVFRYDNAWHKPTLPYREHKHLSTQTVVFAAAPALSNVIEECIGFYQWL
jgi:hypothetical protein